MDHRQCGSREGAGDEDGVDRKADSTGTCDTTSSPHASRYREVFEKPGDPIEGQREPFGWVGLRSPVEASVLGLAVVVSKRLKPGYEAKTSPIDLIRSWVIANVVWPPGAVDEK